MPYQWGCSYYRRTDDGPRVGRPRRDRAKVKAGRRAARRR